jgi:hypothetical protein
MPSTTLTFAITPEAASASNFVRMGAGNGTFAVDFRMTAPIADVIPFHSRGTLGSIVVQDARRMQTLTMRGLFSGDYATVLGDIQDLFDDCTVGPATVTAPDSTSYTDCYIDSANSGIQETRAYDGNAVDVFVQLVFHKHGGF